MIVCHCAVVTDRDVTEAVEGGARTLRQVCGATGAAQNCGTCVFSLKRLLVCHDGASDLASAVTAPEVDVAAS